MKKLKDNFILFIKGFIMGVANIIPGVSGGTLAVILGIFKKFVESISNILKNFKESLLFLIPVVLGMGVAVLATSKVVEASLNNFPLATVLFFVGLILGGIPILFKKIKNNLKSIPNYIIFTIMFVFVLVFTFVISGEKNVELTNLTFIDYILLFIVGMVASASMVIPGISGSMVLMTIGYYNLILNTVSNIFDFSIFWHNVSILIPFGLGVVVGILLIAKLITFLLNKFEIKTYFAIFGFIFSSLIVIFFKNNINFNIIEFIIGIILMVIGFLVSYYIASFNKEEEEVA
jgi:putative membrane protein